MSSSNTQDPARSRRRLAALSGASLIALASAVAPAAVWAQETPSEDVTVGELVVTGSRIQRDGFQAPTPVTVMGADRLEKLAITNVGDALNTLPSFRATSSPATSNIQPANAGMRLADLRGLGPTRTLVLVDGRRFVSSTLQGTVDLNLIPSLLVSRTEVVTGGASAQYGSDAVAGVVNLILNSNLEGIRGQAQYGVTQEGDGEEYQVAVAGGMRFGDGRGHIMGAVEWVENKGVGSCYTREWCALEYQDITNIGAARLAGYPSHNILPFAHTVTATSAGLITSGPLRGTTFTDAGAPRPYQYGLVFPTNTTFMAGGEGDNGFIGAPNLVVPVERTIVYTRGSYELTDWLEGFAELSYGLSEANGRGAQTRDTGNITIRGDNPFLSTALRAQMTAAGIPLTSAGSFSFGRMGDDFGLTQNSTSSEVWRGVVGFKGDLPGGWKWDAYYQYGADTYDQTVANNRIQQLVAGVFQAPTATSRVQYAADATTDAAGRPICRDAAARAAGCVPVNLFGQNQFSAEAKAWLYGTATQQFEFTQNVAAANVTGDLFSTWAGPISVAAGGEYRKNEVSSTADAISATNGFYVFNSTPIRGEIEVLEGYLETAIPLARDMAFAKNLELNGAVRATDYNTSGQVTTWKVGVLYDPVDWLRFRVSRSTDIRAPNTDELFRPRSTAFQTVNGILTPVTTGGNTNLEPETAETFTAGVVFTGSGFLEGLRLSADYYDIDIEKAIGTLTPQLISDRCRQTGDVSFCGQVDFSPSGQVTAVRSVFLNLNRQQTTGYDFEADYRVPLDVFGDVPGSLNLRVLATYLEKLAVTDATGLTVDRAGQNGSNVSGGGAGLPEWQVNGFATYENGPFDLTLQGRWISDGIFDATLCGPDQSCYNIALPSSINDNTVEDRFYLDVGASWEIVRGDERSLTVYGAINNALDKKPPVAPSNQGATNNVLFDPLGRAFKMGVRFRY